MTLTAQSGMYGVMQQAKGSFQNASSSVAIPKGTVCKFSGMGKIAPCSTGEAGHCVADTLIAASDWGMVTMIGGCEVLAGEVLATAGTVCKLDSSGRVVATGADRENAVGFTVGVATAANDIIAFFFLPILQTSRA
jgi:hypothetical protein